jgi:integrase
LGVGQRITAKTRSWEEAVARLRELEAGATKSQLRQGDTRKTILEAVGFYLKKAKDEGNTPDTLNKKTRIFEGLVTEDSGQTKTLTEKIEATKKAKGKFSPSLLAWAEERGFKYLTDLKLQQMIEWRSTWVGAGITRSKRQEKVCGFFHLCRDLGWIEKTPMAGIGAIKVEDTATGYFPPEEYARFFRTIDAWNDGRWPERERIRLKVLTELMRWSGLAIGDACTLKRDHLGEDDSVFLYRGKTGHPVRVLLPPVVATDLRNVPPGKDTHPAYFFWSGNGHKKSAVADWQRVYRRVFKKAGMFNDPLTGEAKRAHRHMFSRHICNRDFKQWGSDRAGVDAAGTQKHQDDSGFLLAVGEEPPSFARRDDAEFLERITEERSKYTRFKVDWEMRIVE